MILKKFNLGSTEPHCFHNEKIKMGRAVQARTEKRAALSTDVELKPQNSADANNDQDFAELGRHAEGG